MGSARARLRGAEGVTRESVAEFEQVVLRAIEETENALVNYREEQERLVRLADQARESTRAATIARTRYQEGRRRFPGAARRGAHTAAGRGRRGTSRGRRVHERHRGLQGPRRNPNFVTIKEVVMSRWIAALALISLIGVRSCAGSDAGSRRLGQAPWRSRSFLAAPRSSPNPATATVRASAITTSAAARQ